MAVLLTAFLTTLPTILAAQASVGVRGGLSLANVSSSSDDIESLGTTQGMNIGGFVNIPLSGVASLQLGAGFVQKGAEESESGATVKIGIDYLEIPLLLMLSPSTTGSVGFNFFVGPAVSFKTGCTLSASIQGIEMNFDCDDPDVDAQLKSIDFGAMIGAGLDIAVSDAASVVLQGFYNLGVTNLDDSGIDTEEAKHRAFSILAGLSFTVGG